MKLLIDTHVFLWMDAEPTKLSPAVKSLLLNAEAQIWMSVVSVWEIVIKQGIGKLILTKPLGEALKIHEAHNRLRILPVNLDHVMSLSNLPGHHKDPFDRLLIAQAVAEDMTIATADPAFSAYPARVLW